MPKQVSIAEARNHLTALIHDAEKGRAVELTRRGKPVAVLVSTREYERMTGGGLDFWSALQAFRAGHSLGDIDVDTVFEGVRDRSPGRRVKW